jgi:hypothetical protein
MVKCFSSGDMGDCILSLPILKHLGGGEYIVGSRPFTRFITWFDVIRPLFEIQPYVQKFRWEVAGEQFTHDMSTFRPPRPSLTLTQLMAEHVKTWPVDVASPWLTVTPTVNDRVIIHRSDRYRNDLFPWQQIVEFYGDRLLMVGLPHEHAQFQGSYGKVEFYAIRDYLDLAQMIAGSYLFIGNQSSPMAVAQGLKHRLIQETCLWTPDCIFPHNDAQYCYDGAAVLPNDRGESITTRNDIIATRNADLSIVEQSFRNAGIDWTGPMSNRGRRRVNENATYHQVNVGGGAAMMLPSTSLVFRALNHGN